jgi:hypothetical protein
MITREQLKAILDRLSPSAWCAYDFRRIADGRVVRFVRYGRSEVRHA